MSLFQAVVQSIGMDWPETLAIVGTLVSVAGTAAYLLYGRRKQPSLGMPSAQPTISSKEDKKRKKKAKSAAASANEGPSRRTRAAEHKREDR